VLPTSPAANVTRGAGGLASGAAAVENPLLLSGLALAGANRRAQVTPDEDDGILTAEEVASLDLDGVEWAVLSACDTGVGEIKAGEGVFGLRRAFQVAGARTVVMSLWSVEDQATRAWMRALYEGRFQRKLSTADAVHQASLTVLRDRRAKGQSTHPFFWAAFVAAGDWR
jgi:CHAT domain-containing protein